VADMELGKTLGESFNLVLKIVFGLGAAAFGLGFLQYLLVTLASSAGINGTQYFAPIQSQWATLATTLMISGIAMIAIPLVVWMLQKMGKIGT